MKSAIVIVGTLIIAAMALTISTTTTTVYAVSENSSPVAICSATMSDPSSHNPNNGPANNCFNTRAEQVDPDSDHCAIAEPIPGNSEHGSTTTGGSANFNCGLPSETHP